MSNTVRRPSAADLRAERQRLLARLRTIAYLLHEDEVEAPPFSGPIAEVARDAT